MEKHLSSSKRIYHQSIQYCTGLVILTILLLFTNSTAHAQTECTGGNVIPFTVTSEDASKKTISDAKIRLSGGLNGDYRIGYSAGSTYTGPAFGAAPKYSTLPSGYISSTLPTPTNTAGQVYTIRVYNVAGTCYTEQQFTLPYVHFNETPKYPDVEVVASASGGTGGFFSLGDLATITLVARNVGDTLAINVTEQVTIPAGLNFISHTAASGTTYNNTTGVWNVGTLNKGETKTLTLTLSVAARGIRSVVMNTATQENGMVQTPALAPDKDSQPGNSALGEDDYGSVCISTPYDFCQGDEYTITLSQYGGIQWYKDGALITGTTSGVTINGNGSITIKSTGVYTYSFPAGACPGGGCCPIKVESGVAPDLQPLTNQVICENGTFAPVTASNTGYTGPTTQHPNGPVVYQWSNDNGTSNPTTTAIAGQNSLSFTAFPTAPGTYKYILRAYAQDHANCKDSTMITLTINPLPLAPVAQNMTYCADETATPLTATAASGNTLYWYTSATGGTGSTTAPTPSTVNASNTTPITLSYWVSQRVDNTSCEGPRTLVTVIINPRPLPPTVANVTYCQEETASPLTATAGSGMSLMWWGTNSAGGTFSTTAPTPSTLAAGTNTFYVSQKIDATGCISNRAAITVIVNPKPTPPVAQNKTYCQEENAVPLTATAVSGQTLYWYGSSATGGTGSTVAPTPSTLTAGTYTFYVSFKVDATNCESNRTPVTVLVNPKPLAPVAQNMTYCADETATALTATAASGNTLYWYTSATGGTASTTAPIPSTVNASNTTPITLQFWVSQKVNATDCESPRTLVTVLINPRPLPPTVANVTYCQEETASPLTATAGSGMSLMWWGTNSAGGTFSTTAPTPSTLAAGTNTFYVSQKIDATGCISNRAAITVVVNPKPAAPTAQNVTYCEGATAVPLTATAVSGQTLYWYGTSATGGTASTTAPTPSTLTAGTYTFYVSFKVDATSCESNRTPVTVLVNPTPAPPTVNNVTYCQGATPSALNATAASGNILQWYTGGSASTTAPIPSTATAGVELFLVSQKVPGTSCESAQAVITVTVNPTPVAEVIAVNSLCIGTTTQNNGKLILTRYRNSDVVAYVAAPATLGTNPTYIDPIPAGGAFATGLANPSAATQNYSVRIKNTFGCTVDRPATLTKVDCGCPGGYCEPATVTKTK